jgi:hypothetical protein
MPAVLMTLISVLKNIAWSFFGEKIMAKVVWWFLEKAAKRTEKTDFDDKLVAQAKAAYYKEAKNG